MIVHGVIFGGLSLIVIGFVTYQIIQSQKNNKRNYQHIDSITGENI